MPEEERAFVQITEYTFFTNATVWQIYDLLLELFSRTLSFSQGNYIDILLDKI